MGKPRTDADPLDFIRYELRTIRVKIKRRLEREAVLIRRIAAIRKGEA